MDRVAQAPGAPPPFQVNQELSQTHQSAVAEGAAAAVAGLGPAAAAGASSSEPPALPAAPAPAVEAAEVGETSEAATPTEEPFEGERFHAKLPNLSPPDAAAVQRVPEAGVKEDQVFPAFEVRLNDHIRMPKKPAEKQGAKQYAKPREDGKGSTSTGTASMASPFTANAAGRLAAGPPGHSGRPREGERPSRHVVRDLLL